jgi:hypothetical protein
VSARGCQNSRMPSRRRFLELGLHATAALALGPMLTRRASAAAVTAPRYVVFIVLHGGYDAIFTTDPRTPREVDPGVDVPYAPDAIVERGGRRLGPHLACMADHLPGMAILNGVRTNTAAHDIGTMQLVRCKTNTISRAPSLLDLIGHAREGQLLGSVAIGADETHYSSGFFGTAAFEAGGDVQSDIFDQILQQSPDEQAMIAASLRAQRKALVSHAGDDRRWLVEQLESGAQLWSQASRWPKLEVEPWAAKYNELPRRLQRAAWVLENDIARGALVHGTMLWDTHEKNSPRQTGANKYTMPLIARFLDHLRTRKNAHGSLADQTLVIVGTEMGRLPFLNTHAGKDHLPQIPFMMFWPGLRAQTFGLTGKQMETRNISVRTGGAGDHPLMLDDVGVTLLRRFGIDPALHGYVGTSLDFVWA